jgi:hypothetical protein
MIHVIRKSLPLATSLWVLLLVQCDKTNPVVTSTDIVSFGTYDISAFLPLTPGNKWYYRISDGSAIALLDRTVLDSQQTVRGLTFQAYSQVVVTTYPPAVVLVEGYLANTKGTIWFADSRFSAPGPPIPVLSSPLTLGRSWANATASGIDSFHIFSVISRTTTAGRIDTSVGVRRFNGLVADSMWFSYGVGMTRRVTRSLDGMFASTFELESHQLVASVNKNGPTP